jgi:hypothetical protein
MDTKHKITIPKPCHEDWNKMTANDNGRFCGSCSKNVVDFTNMSADEIQVCFQQHSNVCGRFKNSQLDSLTIQIPSRVLYSQTHYRKVFLLALFIAMGATLFSCTDKNGNKQKIDKVEVVENSIEMNNITVGVRLPPKSDPNDTLHHVLPPPPPKTEQVKFIKSPIQHKKSTPKKDNINNKVVLGIILPVKTNDTIPIKTNSAVEEIVYIEDAIYKDPEYKGGIKNFKNYIRKNYRFLKKSNTLNGKIQASFIIERDGNLNKIELIKDIGEETGKELIRLLRKSEKWSPGLQNGKPVRNKYYITLFIKNEILKKSFFRTKYTSTIDSIVIKEN